ncbi:hypothetical protein [Enterovibrio norvegicus]|uniref:hypothetical protein n=1 Tax=Enterovibrio norvegicus TaxID=188144 RepID=UPI00352CA2D4
MKLVKALLVSVGMMPFSVLASDTSVTFLTPSECNDFVRFSGIAGIEHAGNSLQSLKTASHLYAINPKYGKCMFPNVRIDTSDQYTYFYLGPQKYSFPAVIKANEKVFPTPSEQLRYKAEQDPNNAVLMQTFTEFGFTAYKLQAISNLATPR